MTDSHEPQPNDAPTEALTRRSMRQQGKPAKPAKAPKPGQDDATTVLPSVAGQPGEQATGAGGEPPKKSGIAALIAKHPQVWLASALGMAFLLLGTGAVFAGIAAGSRRTEAAPLPVASEIPPRPQPSALPLASRLRTCSVNLQATDSRLTTFSGYVVNANTGETLFDRNGTAPQRTGSVLKVITAAAALSALGPDARMTTSVLDGGEGTLVLRGGGDPTLASSGDSFYAGAPRISDLATAAMAKYNELYPGTEVTTVQLDSTLWNPDDNWDSSWLRKEQEDGYQAQVTALMVDGGRSDPSASVSYRTTDPVGEAGQAFANAAGLDDVDFTRGGTSSTTVLATVQSQPISTLIGQMLISSDNILGEMLARVVSKASGFDGSSSSLALAIPVALQAYGLDVTRVTIRDGSGLSDLNAVSPQFMTQLFIKIRANESGLGLIYSNLPVAGQSGTLASRFTGDNAKAAGAVIAKTGWLDSEYSLSGVINAADGTPLTFAFYSIADGIGSSAKEAQDTLAAAVFSCGDNLSNN